MNGPTKPGRRSHGCGDFASGRASLLLRRGSSTARDAGSPSDSRSVRRHTCVCTTGRSPSGYGAEEMSHEETPSGDPRDPADAAPTPRPVCRRERIWEVIKRPWSTRGGKVVHATLQKPGKPGNDVRPNLAGRHASDD